MNKLDKLNKAFDGLTSSTSKQSSEPIQEQSPEQLIDTLKLNPEQAALLQEVRSRQLGRPKGRRNGNPNPPKFRATFVVDKVLINKLKFIALKETRLYTDVVSEAFTKYIATWEKKNEPITF